jgi:hypothetical protein
MPDQTPEVVSSQGMRSSSKTVTRVITGPVEGGNGRVQKQVTVAEVDGHLIFEGDILLSSAAGTVFEGVGITGAQYRWPNKLVPYQIDPNLPNKERVTKAIEHWEKKTQIRFVERTMANASQYTDFVQVEDQGGCFSSVGRQGGKQVVSLGSGCTTGNAIHEIGHTVGLWHEQSRGDRDKFVKVHMENVVAGLGHNFDQHIKDGTDLGNYDYGSIMHYPRDAFSKNSQDTLVPLGGQTIGQRDGLSDSDIAAVASLYS